MDRVPALNMSDLDLIAGMIYGPHSLPRVIPKAEARITLNLCWVWWPQNQNEQIFTLLWTNITSIKSYYLGAGEIA